MKHSPQIAAPVIAAAVLAALSLAGCTLTEPAPFNPRGLQGSSRVAAEDVRPMPMRPLPTTLESPFLEKNGRPTTKPTINDNTGTPLGAEPTVRMSLQEIIQRTVANNGEVRVAGYTPAIDQTRVVEADARFDPTVFANASLEKRTSEEAFNSLGQGAVTTALEGGLRQNLQSGGQVELRYRNSITDEQGGISTGGEEPRFSNELILQLQQPLLRDFGNDINRARININRNNQKISVLEFRRQLEETVGETEQRYWELVQAEREVRIQERLLQRSIDTADIIVRRGGDDVTRAQISQANSSIESRRNELIAARTRVRDLSDQLKRLMQDPGMPTSSPTAVLPAVPPSEELVNFDFDEIAAQAYENRLEFGQQQFRVDNAEIASRVAKNNLLPQLNLNLTGGLQGVDSQWVGALGDQFSVTDGNVFEQQNTSFQVALQFEIPIGNRAARAIYQRAMLQRMQAIEQYRSLVEQVSLEVRTAWRAVNSSWNQIGASRQARFAAADALAAVEMRREQGEGLTPTFVQLILDRQEALAQAERQEASAISNYNINISRLELSKGTLLRYNNVIIEEEQTPFVKTFGMYGR